MLCNRTLSAVMCSFPRHGRIVENNYYIRFTCSTLNLMIKAICVTLIVLINFLQTKIITYHNLRVKCLTYIHDYVYVHVYMYMFICIHTSMPVQSFKKIILHNTKHNRWRSQKCYLCRPTCYFRCYCDIKYYN